MWESPKEPIDFCQIHFSAALFHIPVGLYGSILGRLSALLNQSAEYKPACHLKKGVKQERRAAQRGAAAVKLMAEE